MTRKFINNEEAAELISQQSLDFAVIHNPDYIYPPVELYPLAPKVTTRRENLSAVVMDMDGTTTTTEELCLHSLEYMVRQISNRPQKTDWRGLDHIIDYPHIIGNSTTKHVEFLISRYSNFIKRDSFRDAYFFAALWTLITSHDENRKKEVRNNLINLGCKDMLEDPKLTAYIEKGAFDRSAHAITGYFISRYGAGFRTESYSATVRAAIDIYYQRYHEILELIKNGKGSQLAGELLDSPGKHLIEPMPGVGIFLALVKGWLGEDIKYLFGDLVAGLKTKLSNQYTPVDTDVVSNKLFHLSRKFEESPLKVGIVTSSILYEADIVMKEVFAVLKEQVDGWKIPADRKAFLKEKFSDYRNVYDTFVTASDSSEIRLKPHRDLYSIALYQLGIPKSKFHEVAGFEDSESGTISIRAAGIGLCVAVPFAKTSGHDLSAASYVLNGGLPECLLVHNLFL